MTAARKLAAPEVEYPDSDGKPMAESDLHRKLMTDLIERLTARYAGEPNTYVSGNLLVYFERGNPYRVLAPDGFVAFDVPNRLRRTFKTWEEGKFPDVVFEITSKTTEREDMSHKFDIYQNEWRVKEYFLFDPFEEYLEPSLLGYRRGRGELKIIKPSRGRLTSKLLGITLERDGTRLLLRDVATGQELLLPDAKRARAAERRAKQALTEAEHEKQARLRAEAEVARLKAELAALRRQAPPA
jgi:Uma2 family endonuclease